MSFVKLISSGAIEYASRVIFDDDKSYSNPTEETLLSHGYKPLIETECPNKEGFTYTYKYEDNGKNINQVWIEEPLPEPEISEEVEEPVESEDDIEG